MDNSTNIAPLKILIMEAEGVDVQILKQLLGAEGYNIIQESNVSEGLEKAHSFFPDLILLDVKMPEGMDGLETCRRLKSDTATRDIPVIFISAKGDPEETKNDFEAGGVDYITRPFKKEEIIARVKTHLALNLTKQALRNKDQILEEKLKKRTKELYDSRLEIICSLGMTTEYCDHITPSHVLRMSNYCGLLGGRASGLNKKDLDLLVQVSPIYDIGKIGIPESILLKAGKLDHHEKDIMQRHVAIGTKILSGSQSELINMAETIAETHHERWDGTGYMCGLKGEEIPLVGRICSLCDAFDALTSNRPYRKAFSIDDAMTKIESCKGQYFDPHLVELFQELLPEMRKIKEQFPD